MNEDPPLDDFEIRHVAVLTPGTHAIKTGGKIVLHNHANPCHHAERLEKIEVWRLGKDVPPRPEFRRFCKDCEWPAGRRLLLAALRRVPEQYR